MRNTIDAGRQLRKKCRNCGVTKNAPEFRRNPRCRDGLSSWCSECHVEATRRYRARKAEAERHAAWEALQARSAELRRIREKWEERVTGCRANR